MTTTRRITTDILNDPLFIGFDGLFNKASMLSKNTSNYPPYNIVKTDDDTYVVELAVAGFGEDDIDIELCDGVLTIRAQVSEVGLGQQYMHKGIATRNFERRFTLADTIEVMGAQLYNGLLQIRLQNIVPESKKPKKIPIGSTEPRELLSE